MEEMKNSVNCHLLNTDGGQLQPEERLHKLPKKQFPKIQ